MLLLACYFYFTFILLLFREQMMKRWVITALTGISLVMGVVAQDALSIVDDIARQRYEFPQEKIHVMTDRGTYLAGDTLRFRAWVVDAATHCPVSASKFVYVELLSPIDSLCVRVKIHQDDNGVFQGYLPIPDDLPEGRYQLTAYTLFMQNAGTDYFYRQPVEITGLMSLQRRITAHCVRFDDEVEVRLRYTDLSGVPCQFDEACHLNQYGYMKSHGGGNGEARFTLKGEEARKPVTLVEVDGYAKFIPLPANREVLVDFYPEGGYLVPGVENAVAFKMHDPANLTVKGSGELVDERGEVIAPLLVEHDGMGLVKFTPEESSRYTARWRDNFDEYVAFDLPQVRSDATVVQVRFNEVEQIIVQAAGTHSADAVLVVQQRGCPIAASRDAITLDEDELSPGVVQALLMDENGRCLSERLFFAGQRTLIATPVETDRSAYDNRDAVSVTVDMNRLVMSADGGDCAVAVVDDRAAVITEGNIYSSLLLQSDLRGSIRNPEYYFELDDDADDDARCRHLDMLMMTQGWRRYDIPRVLRGRVIEPQFPIEVSQVVAGRVLSEWRKKPVAEAQVSLIIPSMEYANMGTTDSAGCFSIPVPLLVDRVDCVVLATNNKGKNQTNLELADEQYPDTYYLIDADTQHELTREVQEEQAWRLISEDDWRHIMLNELVVTAASHRRKPTVERNKVLTADDISRLGISSVDAALREMGVNDLSKVTIRIDGEPLSDLYFTDTETFQEALTITTNDWKNDRLKRISFAPFYTGTDYDLSDVSIAEGFVNMRDVNYVRFSRGRRGSGVIDISRKQGAATEKKEPSRFVKIARPMGVQRPVEFFTPRYDQGDCGIEPGNDLRRVLYWNPQVKAGEDGLARIEFYCNDVQNTTYTILVEGITGDGSLLHGTQTVTKR